MQTLLETSKKFKPLVIESSKNIMHNGIVYKRRLRINGYTTLLLDEVLGTEMYKLRAKFVILNSNDLEKVCETLGIKFKSVNTYIQVDLKMCSFASIPV